MGERISPTDSPPELNVAAFVRDALATQQPGEEFEAALRRTTYDPRGDGMVCQLICKFLQMQTSRLGISRQQAAEQLAQADTHLRILSDGTPFLEAVTFSATGLESLPAEMREDVLRQIHDSLAQGKLPPAVIQPRPRSSGQGSVMLVLVFLVVLGLAYFLSR